MSWAILGEVYGRLTDGPHPFSRLGLTVRRLRTNLQERGLLAKLPFQPEPLFFESAGPQLFNRVTHNGFMIEHGDQERRVAWADHWFGLRALLPPLHILDRKGNSVKPYLNLARTEFIQAQFGPLQEVCVDVLRDYIAFLLVTVPPNAKDIGDSVLGRRNVHYLECLLTKLNQGFGRDAVRSQPIVYTREGVALFDAAVLKELGIVSLILIGGGITVDVSAIDSDTAVLLLGNTIEQKQVAQFLYPVGGLASPPVGLNILGSLAVEMEFHLGPEPNKFSVMHHRGEPMPMKDCFREQI